jgi:hypothetical protein
MKKKFAVLGLVVAFLMLMLTVSPAFAASPIIKVSGKITSGGTIDSTREAGENVFLSLTTASTWTADVSGGISGSTTGSQTWIVHNGGKDTHTNYNVEIHFTTATVDGKTGAMTVEMNMIAWPNHRDDNHGTWRIKDASGGLEGLHGGGEWITYKNGVRVNIYEGTVHFSSP